MRIIEFISAFMIPFVIFYIVGFGVLHKCSVFETFLEGCKNGFHIVLEIAPTIVGLFVAIGILRTSGALDFICKELSFLSGIIHIPVEIIPVSIVKLFSSSAANGLLFDLFKSYGPDSFIGMTASILLSCTETLFYTISVYFMSIGVRKCGWTIPVGIFIVFLSVMISVWIAMWFT